MFHKCWITLSQGGTEIEITLLRPTFGPKFTDYGLVLGGARLSTDAYKDRQWEIVLTSAELRLYDERGPGIGMVGKVNGRVLKHGEVVEQDPLATLKLAYLSTRGIEPINPGKVGAG